MTKIYKKFFAFILIFTFTKLFFFSATYGKQELIPAGHWSYDALFMLSNESKMTSMANNAPITVAEFQMYLNLIPYEKLSDTGKSLYDNLQEYLNSRKLTFDMGGVYFGFNVDLYPQILGRTNKDIDWSFATDYTGHVNPMAGKTLLKEAAINNLNPPENQKIQNNYIIENISVGNNSSYMYTGNFSDTQTSKAFLSLPLYLGFGENILIRTDPILAKSIWGMADSNNFTNTPYTSSDFDFLWPRTAYGSVGKAYKNWGYNINISRQGLLMGKTQTGSIIYNNSFETDGYFQLNLYSPRMRYNLDVVEVSKNKYLYLHLIDARPLFNWVRFSVLEGMLIQQPFELRFLNPIMIMHSFGAWEQYMTDTEQDLYGEAHVCAYMGIQVEITPVKNLRIYFLYAQNEIQSQAELGSVNGKCMPDSLGGQLGFELTVPDKNGGWWLGTLEGIYTTPYLYVKQGADWSLYSERHNMQSNPSLPIYSWIGTPLGPDAIGLQTRVGYTKPSKWNAEFDYLFVAHGTNSFGLFNNTITIDGQKYYAYYPSVLNKMGMMDSDELIDIARSYKLTGTVQFTNQATVKGSYTLNEHFDFNGQMTYTFIINNKNIMDDFAQGFEFQLGANWKLF